MRTIFGILVVSVSLLACSMDGLFSNKEVPDTQLTGSWSGEVNGVRIAFTMNTAMCEFGCSVGGVGSVLWGATGDSIPIEVNSCCYLQGVPSKYDFDLELVTAAAADDTQLSTSFSMGMPDASHLVGRVLYDDLLQVDTGITVIFTRK